MEELEASWHESRKNKGSFDRPSFPFCYSDLVPFYSQSTHKEWDSEDLLVANPNHGIIPGEGSSDDDAEELLDDDDNDLNRKGPPPSPPESDEEADEEKNQAKNSSKGKEAAKV
jgi:hypothetical protein